MAKIVDIEGIGEVYTGKLQEIGIETTGQREVGGHEAEAVSLVLFLKPLGVAA